MSKECLMIETSEKQKFFTPKKNYTQLLEFAKSFNCEISVVELDRGEVLSLEDLADAITTKRNCKHAKYSVLEIKKGRKRRL